MFKVLPATLTLGLAASLAASSKVTVGQPVPAFSVATAGGDRVDIGALRGKRVLVFVWASWWLCREQLPVWQEFYEKNKHRNFELVAVAMDAADPARAREFYDRSGATFVRGIDQSDGLWEALGFQVVPNGVLLDEQGIVRYAKFGGFEARDPEDMSAVERLLAAPPSPQVSRAVPAPAAPAPAVHGPARRWFQRGIDALNRGDKTAAAQAWRKALELNPDNLVIRKQIWALEHPEEFYPRINTDWQRRQLAEERKNRKR